MPKEITLKEFTNLKNDLDSEICSLIVAFANTTGFVVMSIDVSNKLVQETGEIYVGVKSTITNDSSKTA